MNPTDTRTTILFLSSRQLFRDRFPEAPEVKAAYATFLAAKGDQIGAQRKFLEIPDRQREKFSQNDYMTKVVSWPPKAMDTIYKVAAAVGDKRS